MADATIHHEAVAIHRALAGHHLISRNVLSRQQLQERLDELRPRFGEVLSALDEIARGSAADFLEHQRGMWQGRVIGERPRSGVETFPLSAQAQAKHDRAIEVRLERMGKLSELLMGERLLSRKEPVRHAEVKASRANAQLLEFPRGRRLSPAELDQLSVEFFASYVAKTGRQDPRRMVRLVVNNGPAAAKPKG
jgi:hypothetical protein